MTDSDLHDVTSGKSSSSEESQRRLAGGHQLTNPCILIWLCTDCRNVSRISMEHSGKPLALSSILKDEGNGS